MTYTEWVPDAEGVALIGDFNDWQECHLQCGEFGVWSVSLPDGQPLSISFAVSTFILLCSRYGVLNHTICTSEQRRKLNLCAAALTTVIMLKT